MPEGGVYYGRDPALDASGAAVYLDHVRARVGTLLNYLPHGRVTPARTVFARLASVPVAGGGHTLVVQAFRLGVKSGSRSDVDDYLPHYAPFVFYDNERVVRGDAETLRDEPGFFAVLEGSVKSGLGSLPEGAPFVLGERSQHLEDEAT